MATQLKTDELTGCISYFEWLVKKLGSNLDSEKIGSDRAHKLDSDTLNSNTLNSDTLNSDTLNSDTLGRSCADVPSSDVGEVSERSFEDSQKVALCRFLFGVDFRIGESGGCVEDLTQATNGMELRRRYAESVGRSNGKSERDIDRIWKSIHGKCSVLEFLIHLCTRLDDMTNEEESGKEIGKFFDIFMANLDIDITEKPEIWQMAIDTFLDRKYGPNGYYGGLFPMKNWNEKTGKDQRTVPIWTQLNTWLNEHLDDEGQFFE